MATYYDGLNYVFKLFEEEPPTSSAQLIFLHLLHENNRHGNIGTVQISDRELGYRTRLSKQSITEAKRTLKNRGLIDFKTDRDKPHGGTIYILPYFKEGQEVGRDLGHKVGQTIGQQSPVPYAHTREDLRLKTKDLQGESEARAHASTSAGVNRNSEMDVHELWEYETGYPLTGSVAYELETLERTHGRESFHAALIKAVKSKDTARLRFSYFKAVLEGGGRKVERTSERDSTADFLGYDPN